MNKLVVACYCANFENYDFFEKLLEGVKDRGVGIELSFFDDPGYLERLKAQKERFADYYTTFHGAHLEVEATSPEGSEGYKRIVRSFSESMQIMKEFNGQSLVLHTNQTKVTPETKAELMKNSLHTLNVIGEEAAREGIQLVIENVGETIYETLLFDEDEFIDLFNKVNPASGCLIDVGHAMINEWDMKRVIRALGSRIKAYHLHNNDGTADSHRPMFEPGNKFTKEMFADLLACAEEYSPDADWILEYSPTDVITPELIKYEVDEVLKLVKK